MKRLITLISIMLVSVAVSKSQYVGDALKYSLNFPVITARSLAMGNAFTSLGGDFSSAYTNPAGLGLYRKSEFLFSPGLGYSGMKSNYFGTKNDDFKYQFIMGNLGYVGTYNSNKDKGLVSASYAVGYNRLNNFNGNTYIRGTNSANSLTDYFVENANGVDPENLDAFYERLAFDSYIIDTIAGSNFEYAPWVPLPVDQRKSIETTGGTGQWTFALGMNFSNVFYLGFGMGINQLQYKQTTVHSEFYNGNENDFNSFRFTEELDVEGTGFTANMGMMVRIMKIVKVGAILQLPTYYKLGEVYYNTMHSEFDGDTYDVVPTDINGDRIDAGAFDYRLNTPLRLQSGASLQLGTTGIIAADIEFVNYSGMRLRERDSFTDFEDSNREIAVAYRSVVNLKLGGEIRFGNLSLRAGGGYYPSPYSSGEMNAKASYSELTTGLGYRDKNFFFDLGFSGLFHQEKYILYYDNTSSLDLFKYRLLATVGFRF